MFMNRLWCLLNCWASALHKLSLCILRAAPRGGFINSWFNDEEARTQARERQSCVSGRFLILQQ